MKAARVARILGIDQKTVSNWTNNELFRRFFSAEALSEDSPRLREYTESDILVLNTIRHERARNISFEEIEIKLSNGNLDRNLPASSLLVEAAVPAIQYERFMVLMNERDAALKEVERLSQEGKLKDTMLAELRKEIQQLNRELGKLEGRLESYDEHDKGEDKS